MLEKACSEKFRSVPKVFTGLVIGKDSLRGASTMARDTENEVQSL